MTQLEQLKAEAREILHSELEVDTQEYTPDQGMPPIIYELNDARLDYFIERLYQARTEEVVKIAEGMKTGLTETEYAEGHPQEEAYDQSLTDLIATLKDTKGVDHRCCPPTNSPCGHEGTHRCCLCGEDTKISKE